ncbi:helix-turn-helix transcriptional regulator [Paenibacillus sp. S150]|uniref:helix-turn-helix transcriptional regulator n=1 Tax=Paenibacillus sp. S150 TaxID=2749826 RepID=UPI001C55C748|nr:helix-turn-helix transcriptional regulator [Paenibacillus sp. S150]MBW4083655.1 helix-turn-helix transcriptional regulator [Paenibacillus sp. S150]
MFEALGRVRHLLGSQNTKLFHFDQTFNRYAIDPSIFKPSSGRLTAVEILPKDGIPVHCSSSFLTILYCGGKCTIELSDAVINCFAGNIILFRDGCRFVVQPETGTEVYIAYYDKELFDSLFHSQIADLPLIYDFFHLEDCNDEFLYFDCNMNMKINHSIQALLLELCENNYYSEKTIRCTSILLLSNLHLIHQGNLVISESSMMKKYLIGSILKYMADNCSIVTLNSTAAHFNYHPAYFSAMFKRLANTTFSKKVMELRMERARRMLDYTNLSVKEIWQSTGFEEHSHFHRSFKGAYGVTPNQYRKKVQNGE